MPLPMLLTMPKHGRRRATALLANELEAATMSRSWPSVCPPRQSPSKRVPRPSPRFSAPSQLALPDAIGARGGKIGAYKTGARKSRGYSLSSSG
jgi:hypothetical protein